MKGLDLSKAYYYDCVQHIIAEHLPQLKNKYAAGLIGYGSDVIGNDDELSQDHEWGPRILLFLTETTYSTYSNRLDIILNQHLPRSFRGFPTRFKRDVRYGNTLVMTTSPAGQHHIVITTPERHMLQMLGMATVPLNDFDWLAIPEQILLEFTAGAIFVDPVGDISSYRQQLAYFPTTVWQYKLAYIFESIGWELGLIALCGRRGDSISMHLNAAITVERLMKLAFLVHRRYCPGYKKWLQREFAKLPGTSATIAPLLQQVLETNSLQEKLRCVHEALDALYQRMLSLDTFIADLPDTLPKIDDRGTEISDTQRVARYLMRNLSSPLQTLQINGAPYGAIDQWVTNEDILLSAKHTKALQDIYTNIQDAHKKGGYFIDSNNL